MCIKTSVLFRLTYARGGGGSEVSPPPPVSLQKSQGSDLMAPAKGGMHGGDQRITNTYFFEKSQEFC